MSKEIFFDAPCVGETEKKYLYKAVDSGFISSVGPFVPEFEKKVKEFLGAKGAVAIQSGTAAIYMSLYELSIGPGDEVIVPALTFAATINPVLYVGATPVIVDVDINTWNIDPIKIKEAITDKTKAIIPVHLYGNPCNMTDIMDIAKGYNLYIIEDATESLGAKFNHMHTGTLGNLGCFSFNGNKLITTGGGGMIISNNIDKIEHIRYLVNQSKDKNRPGFHSEMGFNYRMTNIEAALGLAQIGRLVEFLDKKKKFNEIYKEELKDIDFVHFQEEYEETEGCWWFSCIIFEKDMDILTLQKKLKDKGVPTKRTFMSVNEMPYLNKYSATCSNARKIYDYGICLPCSTLNEEKDIKEAALIIKKVLND